MASASSDTEPACSPAASSTTNMAALTTSAIHNARRQRGSRAALAAVSVEQVSVWQEQAMVVLLEGKRRSVT